MGRIRTIARRSFLIGSAAIAGGVAFGWWKYATPYANPLAQDLPEGSATLTPYVLIDASGVTVIAPRAEMGQGIHSTLAALVAEEMDLDWTTIKVIHGPASHAYYNAAVLEEGVPFAPTDHGWLAESLRAAMHVPAKFLGMQITGGSSSVPDAFDKMREAGAVARAALVQAAAQRLGVDPSTLSTRDGAVQHAGGAIAYADLAAEAARVDLPETVALKPRSDWRLLGQSLPRPDMLPKVTGTAAFTADLRLPGMRFATIRANPRLGGALLGYDATKARAMAGVEQILELPDAVAVVATNTWAAFKAAEAISFDWGPAPYPADSAAMDQALRTALAPDHQDSRMRDEGDVDAALPPDAFTAEYSAPYLAHAPMEPMAACALMADGKLTVWAGNQAPTVLQAACAAAANLPADAVTIHTPFMGGGFGRRAEADVAVQATRIALQMQGTPVLLTWSREEDTTHDFYRPMARARLRASVAEGKVQAFDFHTVATSVVEGQMGRIGLSLPGPDATIVQGAWEQPYGFANYRVTGYRAPMMAPVGSWRSVGASQNGFFHESAVDELAHLAGADPMAFRLDQITDDASRQVLQAVARMSDWANPPAGRARGVAFCLSFGVPSAQVIEVENTQAGIRLTGIWAAVDVGTALDPRIIEAQVQGAIVYALSAAMGGEITFADGAVQQSNFYDYPPLRLNQCPPIVVQVLENGPKIKGIGEPGTPPTAPALANAIFALTGQRLRDLPLSKAVSFA